MIISCLHAATQDLNLEDEESGSLEQGATIRLRYVAPVTLGMTFRLCVEEGRIIVYASTIPNPSSAQYGWRDEVTASAHPLTCLTTFYNLAPMQSNRGGTRRRRQTVDDTTSLYITLEGRDGINDFSFDSAAGNVTFGNSIIARLILILP